MSSRTAVDRRGGLDRRVARVSLHYPERRMGFDRRGPAGGAWGRLVGWYRDRPAAVAAGSALILGLGLLDVLLTGRLVAAGASELNPVMSRLLAGGTGGALAFKALVMVPVAAGVWWLRRFRRVLEFSLVVLAGSVLLVAYELAAVAFVGG